MKHTSPVGSQCLRCLSRSQKMCFSTVLEFSECSSTQRRRRQISEPSANEFVPSTSNPSRVRANPSRHRPDSRSQKRQSLRRRQSLRCVGDLTHLWTRGPANFTCVLHYLSTPTRWDGSPGQVCPKTGPKRPNYKYNFCR
jgi:hypothetical protein